MSAREDELTLRFEAGKLEDSIVMAILVLQVILVTGAAAMVAAVLFLRDGLELVPFVIPAVIAVVATAVLLNRLYE
ncbi:hypothetical protein GS429_07120 [Natronorubrum sp. JWXQ-INN-674]|uniref:Uncharacterized protein n=1 Tax=Natronorubrum halalkaliphilum TaxID=2691917 RepID=A0A6B0VJW9_9EURY|nr:hypothetical protein [Natronorubrum halalkaliphilum]MXV61840.1 hypothetical protein [Natronorubrum halalkaliphilum]